MVRGYDPAAGEAAAALMPELDVRPDPYEAAAGSDVVALLTEWEELRWLDFERVRASMRRPAVVDAAQPARPGGDAPARVRVQRDRPPMSRIVITGGAGFVGSHLCESMLDRGDVVVAVDNLSTSNGDNVAHLIDHPDFDLVVADVCDDIPVSGRVDGVLHMASPASPPEYLAMPLETLDVSSLGTRRALDLARANDAPFLLASTSEIYGDPLEHPQAERYLGNVNSIGTRAVYDEAKRFAETLTMTYHRVYDLPTRIVRIFNTYGPRLRAADGRVVSNFLVQAIAGEPLTVYGERNADAFVLLRRRRGARNPRVVRFGASSSR